MADELISRVGLNHLSSDCKLLEAKVFGTRQGLIRNRADALFKI